MAIGLLDTSVVIDWDHASVQRALPDQISVSALTLAELAAGPILATSVTEQSSRQARLQQAEATFDPIPFDAAAARSFGQVVAAIASTVDRTDHAWPISDRGNRSRQRANPVHP